MAILTQEELHALHKTIIDAHLGDSRAALLATIDEAFRAALPKADVPGQQVLLDLDFLNSTERLADGSVPLLIWLRNAESLAASQTAAATFRATADRILRGGTGGTRGETRPPGDRHPVEVTARFRVAHVVGAAAAGLVAGALLGFVARGPAAPLDDCRTSLERLDTQSKLPGVTVDDLKNGIGGHISRCRALLDDR